LQGCSTLIKDIYNVTVDFHFKLMQFFELSIHQRILKNFTVSTKI